MKTNLDFNVNASIQLVPLGEIQPYPLVDQAIKTIEESGLAFEVGPFSTSVEASLKDVFALVEQIKERVWNAGGNEILINLQIHARKSGPVSSEEKVKPFRS